jgi:hypothetical protein
MVFKFSSGDFPTYVQFKNRIQQLPIGSHRNFQHSKLVINPDI